MFDRKLLELIEKDYPFLHALLQDAEQIKITWDFDEQQADPIHHNFTYAKLKKEISALLLKIESIPAETGVMPKPEIEFRPNMDDVDEIVAHNAQIHLEYMNDSSIWMSITIPGKEYHVWINPKNPKSQAHIKTWAERVG
ncbi:MAG: hypothetical protein PVH88_02070 [Ignavibacteria bacterium]|jgi:hypothetical protein